MQDSGTAQIGFFERKARTSEGDGKQVVGGKKIWNTFLHQGHRGSGELQGTVFSEQEQEWRERDKFWVRETQTTHFHSAEVQASCESTAYEKVNQNDRNYQIDAV